MEVYGTDGTFRKLIVRRKDFKTEERLENGIVKKQLEFSYPAEDGRIFCEEIVTHEGERYRVKEAALRGRTGTVTAQQDVYSLSGHPVASCKVREGNVAQCVEAAIAGTGWKCVNRGAKTDDVRDLEEENTDSMKLLEKIAEIFWVEMEFQAKEKTVYLYERIGAGAESVRFVKGMNLRSLEVRPDSNEFYTRILPIGKDGLTIAEVNGGKQYLEDFRYSKEIRTLRWEDGNYADAAELKKAAEKKLQEISAPKTTYTAQIIDLANVSDDYAAFAFGIGEDADIIEPDMEIEARERIVSIVRYPDEPVKNTVELANRTVSFAEMQKKVIAAMETVGKVTDGDKIIINPVTDEEIDAICIM